MHYWIPADPEATGMIARREANWFEVRHGSIFHVIKRKLDTPALRVEEIPAERWEPRTVAGKPAAVAPPIAGSFGHAAVLVWDQEKSVLIQVSGDSIALDELLRIAEGLR
jgi:hypothetical protein